MSRILATAVNLKAEQERHRQSGIRDRQKRENCAIKYPKAWYSKMVPFPLFADYGFSANAFYDSDHKEHCY